MKKALLGLMLLGATAFAGPRIAVGISIGAPPPPAYVVRPACPGPGYVWVDGYYRSRVWVPGYWRAPVRYYAPPPVRYYGPPARYYVAPPPHRGYDRDDYRRGGDYRYGYHR